MRRGAGAPEPRVRVRPADARRGGMIRVAIDARRQRDNGVARVTRLLATAIRGIPVQAVLLGPYRALKDQFPWAEVRGYDAPLLSPQDLLGLDQLLRELRIDCLIAPQFYVSPWTTCPQVRILHDAIPLEREARLPRLEDVRAAFGEDAFESVGRSMLGRSPTEPGDVALVYRAYYDASVRESKALLTVSNASRRALTAHYPEIESKISVLPLFADGSVVALAQASVAKRPFDAIHVSKFEPRKNQPALLAAWAQIWAERKSFRACIVGSPSHLFPEHGRRVLDAIVDGVSAGWLLHYEGIPDGALAKLYASSRTVCVPSVAEGFGLPALEGMANGCVVVAASGTAVDEICDQTLVAAEDSAESLADALSSILGDTMRMGRLSDAGRQRAATYREADAAAVLRGAIQEALTE